MLIFKTTHIGGLMLGTSSKNQGSICNHPHLKITINSTGSGAGSYKKGIWVITLQLVIGCYVFGQT